MDGVSAIDGGAGVDDTQAGGRRCGMVNSKAGKRILE